MPVLDMPIKEMEGYLGKGICPIDFQEFWIEQKNKADSLRLKYTITEKTFKNSKANYYEINFKSVDGSNIYAKYISPKGYKKTPTVIEFHDYKASSRSWHHLTRYVGIGYSVVAMDCRGQGGKSEDVNIVKGPTVSGHLIKGIEDEKENLYYVNLYLDGYILSKIVEELESTDCTKVITFGKGQGAALALVTSALNGNIKKCSMQYPFLCDFKRVWDMDLDQENYEGIRYYFRWFDPMHKREEEFFNKLGYIDIVNFAKMVNSQVLMGTALLDKVCPPSTQYAVFNNLKCEKDHVVFPKYEHDINNFFENENLKFMKF